MRAMKSRFDALTSPADRRTLATFRASAAIAVVLFLLCATVLLHEDRSPREPRTGFVAIEVGLPNLMQADLMMSTPTSGVLPAPGGAGRVADDEFSLSPDYSGEPGSY